MLSLLFDGESNIKRRYVMFLRIIAFGYTGQFVTHADVCFKGEFYLDNQTNKIKGELQ
jgi:hypothetical protein